MKKVFFFIAFLFAAANSFAQSSVYVSGYTNSVGTYVQSYYRTAPNSTVNDNYSTVGNINSYTGSVGTLPRDTYYNTSSYSTPTYSSSYSTPAYSTTPVYTGSRGGQYYINSNGNKTYIRN